MDLRRKANGRLELRWWEAGRKRGRTFDRKGDAEKFMAWLLRRRQLGQAAIPEDVRLCELVLKQAIRAARGRFAGRDRLDTV